MYKYLFLAMLFFNSITTWAQTNTISGYVYDGKTNEILIGATLYDSITKTGTATNKYGFYSLTLKESSNIQISYVGYSSMIQRIEVGKHIDFKLNPITSGLKEVVISSSQIGNPVETNEFNVVSLTPTSIAEYPLMFGGADVIKAIQLQPGVATLGEGSSGFFVQGGGADQNLMLIDEAPIYNASHLFGLVSVFNPDAIKHVSFYKSPMPAEYGGKISSVVDAQMKDGNKQRFQLSGGISTLTAHIAAEGPLVKNKASYLVALRRSTGLYANAFNPVFYDLNAKINWNINANNRLFVSVYSGRDKLDDDDFLNTWGNTTTTVRWSHIFSPKLFSNLSIIYSDYKNDREFKEIGKQYHWLTGVNDITGKLNFSWFLNPINELKFGLESTYHKFIPGENNLPESSLFRINALETAAYISHDINLKPWLGINYGIRAAVYQNMGEGQWYSYENYVPTGLNQNKSGVYNTYTSFEPRVTLNLKLNSNATAKIGYSKTAQFSQVIQNSIYSYSALQTWLPANPNFKPLYANIFSLGYYGEKGKFTFSLEGYYKTINNIIDYVDHAQLINNPYIENQLRSGTQNAYGASIEVKRESDKLKLSLTYTYSRVFNTIDGINNGNTYAALQDIPHDIRLSAYYKPTPRIGIGGYWTYHTGYTATFPMGYIGQTFNPIPIYGDRNSSRMPNYHRLDLSVNLLPKENNKRWESTWSAGVYNAYSRLNPMGIEFYAPPENLATTVTLYRIVPYMSYNFKF